MKNITHILNKRHRHQHAFTLLEITVATVIVGVIGAFSVANYNKAIWKAELNYAYTQAKLLQGALEIYKAQHGQYWIPPTNRGYNESTSIAQINSALGLNLNGGYTTSGDKIGFNERSYITSTHILSIGYRTSRYWGNVNGVRVDHYPGDNYTILMYHWRTAAPQFQYVYGVFIPTSLDVAMIMSNGVPPCCIATVSGSRSGGCFNLMPSC